MSTKLIQSLERNTMLHVQIIKGKHHVKNNRCEACISHLRYFYKRLLKHLMTGANDSYLLCGQNNIFNMRNFKHLYYLQASHLYTNEFSES